MIYCWYTLFFLHTMNCTQHLSGWYTRTHTSDTLLRNNNNLKNMEYLTVYYVYKTYHQEVQP